MNRRGSVHRAFVTGLVVLASVLIAGQALAQGTWETKAPMPTARSNGHGGVIGDLLYVAGGHLGGALGVTGALEVYSPATDSWTAAASMPGPVYSGAIGVIDGKLYVAGGWNWPYSGIPQRTLQIYDPATNAWSFGPNMPRLSGCSEAGVINRKLYVHSPCDGYSGLRNRLHIYDANTNSWLADGPPAPNIHADGAAAVIDGKLYVVGGQDLSGLVSSLDVYDPATNSWASLAPMPTPRWRPTVGVINGKLYVAGGQDWTYVILDILEVYDPATNTWSTETPMPTARTGSSGGVIGGKFYVAGGGGLPPAPTVLEVFSPTVQVTIDIKPGSDPNSINLCSHGVVPVAILGSAYFHVSDIVVQTSEIELVGSTIAIRGKDKWLAYVEDVNSDGFDDLVVHIETENLNLVAGDTEATLTGKLGDETPFEGTDSIRIVPESDNCL